MSDPFARFDAATARLSRSVNQLRAVTRPTVLVVDDDPDCPCAEELGAVARVVVTRPEEVAAQARQAHPQAALFDTSQFQALRDLREDGDETPAVLLSASLPEGPLPGALGPGEVRRKPLAGEALRAAVGRWTRAVP